MKQGIKKFTNSTQGGRTKEGQKIGEKFVQDILDLISIENLKINKYKKSFSVKLEESKTSMSPDFIIENMNKNSNYFKDCEFLILESKYKQISGSDWEKIESNFGYHEYFYNKLANFNSKSIVILSGYWRELQKNYIFFMKYFKEKYGEHLIYDFGDSVDEIYRFCNFLNIKIDSNLKEKINTCWKEYKSIPK